MKTIKLIIIIENCEKLALLYNVRSCVNQCNTFGTHLATTSEAGKLVSL